MCKAESTVCPGVLVMKTSQASDAHLGAPDNLHQCCCFSESSQAFHISDLYRQAVCTWGAEGAP